MIVTVQMDRMGFLTITPKSERWQRRFSALLTSADAPHTEAEVFLQGEADIDSFLEGLSASAAKDIAAGWRTNVKMDEWEFGQMLGYDCGDRLNERPEVATDDSRSFGPSGCPAGWQ